MQNEGLSLAAAGGRVSALGSVPLQDARPAAAAELEYLMQPSLGCAVPRCRNSGVAGRYLGDEAFLPLWEAAEATGALIFVHPAIALRGFELARAR